ncbi:MAG: hypothetical protein ACO3EZ_11785 [Prochlorotrichaceae cyanobacterium]
MTLPNPPAAISSFLAPGVRTKEIVQVVDLSTAAASFSISQTLPANSIVIAAAMSIQQTITAATAVKIGLGRVTATADPDKYLLSAALTAAELAKPVDQWAAPLTAAETIGVFACDTNGAAAGTIGGGAGDVVVIRVVYLEALTLY